MAEKANIGALLTKHLGKEAGDAMAAKIDKMISAKKSAAHIEKTIIADLIAHSTKQVSTAVDKCPPLSSQVRAQIEQWIGACASVATRISPHVRSRIAAASGPLRKGRT